MDKNALKNLAGKSKRAALVYRALNNPLRQKFLLFLLEHPDSAVIILSKKLRIIPPVCSMHLAILRRQGIVTARREGTRVLYTVNAERLSAVERLADELLSG